MKSSIHYIIYWAAFTGLLFTYSSCRNDVIAPANQSVAFIKYYGHVSNQSGADLIATSDGGFLMVGSTNSFISRDEGDAFVVKTDSLGNEEWSVALGRTPDDRTQLNTGDRLDGFYVRFDEAGKQAIEKPDQSGYLIGIDRTYVLYPNSTSLVGSRDETKIALYELDVAGGTVNSMELAPGSASVTNHSQNISDIYIDTSSSIVKYIIGGVTTDVGLKPGDQSINALTDKSDLFIARLEEDFTITWTGGSSSTGFQGADYGLSIHKVPLGYMLTSIVDFNYGSSNINYEFFPAMAAVIYNESSGGIARVTYYGARDYRFDLGQSVHDEANQRITLFGHLASESPTNPGQLAIIQIDESTTMQSVGSNPDAQGFTYYDVNGTAARITPYKAASINLLPNGEGFILASTFDRNSLESNICLLQVDAQFDVASTDWPYYFGADSPDPTFATQDQAGTILPISQTVTGTSQVELSAYVFTGTFGLGTNNMIGLVKLNPSGQF